MSTLFKPEWLQPGAVIPVDISTVAAFADELRRVMQENEVLRQEQKKPKNLRPTLRDYFAAKTMQLVFEAWEEHESWGYEDIAEISYEMADAMLEQRKKEPSRWMD